MKPKPMAAGVVSVDAGRDLLHASRDQIELERIEPAG
jgi:hypothetical protein